MKTSRCRSCKSIKAVGDICPVCAAGLPVQTLRSHKGQPVSLARAHFFHAAAAGVSASIAKGDYR